MSLSLYKHISKTHPGYIYRSEKQHFWKFRILEEKGIVFQPG